MSTSIFDYGSAIVKADFHLHTRKDREFKYDGDEDRFVSDYVAALKNAGIQIGIITNHNKFDLSEFKSLSKKAKGEGIFLLPGVELSIDGGSNGLHMLLTFNPNEWLEQDNDHINKFLDNMFAGVTNRDSANINSKRNIGEMLEMLHSDYNKDFFATFAHVEQSKGLIQECQGGVVKVWSGGPYFKQSVLAVQKLRTRDNEGKLRQWLGYDLAQVEGSDPKCLGDVGKDGNVVYLKLGEYSFAAVKYALIDHGNRVFKSFQPPKHGHIKAIQFTGGKLDGKEAFLSPYLNTLIGIRGSGKSSLLEVIRWGLDLSASEDKQYKDSLINNVLESGGQISVFVVDGNGKEYEIRRINGESAKIIGSDGKAVNASIGGIIDNPLYFGQKDLSASKTGYENRLLEKFIGGKVASREAEIKKTTDAIIDGIRQLISLSGIPEKIKEFEAKNDDLSHKVNIFEEKGIAGKLSKQTAFGKDEVKLKTIIEAMVSIESSLTNFLGNDCDSSAYSLDGYTSDNNVELFKELHETLNKFKLHIGAIAEIGKQIEDDVRSAKVTQSKFVMLSEELKEEFAQIKREINSDNLDLDSFVKFKGEIEGNNAEIEKLRRTQNTERTIKDSIANAVKERNDLLKTVFDGYKSEVEAINASQRALVVSMLFKGDKSPLTEALKGLFRGTGVRDVDGKCKNLCEKFADAVAILDDLFLLNGKELKKCLSDTDYVKLGEKLRTEYESFACCLSPNSTEISYHGKPLKSHSIGQRASALILFILSQNQNDIIIIDQPEDDLDNQVVYKEFIKTLKEKKNSVQFIFATHNANIPVLGDSEKIIATEYAEDKIVLDFGTIDSSTTHEKIIDIMEGGEDAFKRRNEIYTTWRSIMTT